MEVKITKNEEVGTYQWVLYDGPDGIDWYEGTEYSLGKCFEEIIRARTLIGLSYTENDPVAAD